jgi:hypothetical protein
MGNQSRGTCFHLSPVVRAGRAAPAREWFEGGVQSTIVVGMLSVASPNVKDDCTSRGWLAVVTTQLRDRMMPMCQYPGIVKSKIDLDPRS